jgi:hypothetical protein
MKEAPSRLHRKLKVAGCLIMLGLLIEAATLYWSHPASFLGFLGIGGFVVIAGIAVYLLSIVSE